MNITIQVNIASVAGLIKTQLSEGQWRNDEHCQSLITQKTLCRIGMPDELLGAAVFLASEASSFVTRAILPVDGRMIR